MKIKALHIATVIVSAAFAVGAGLLMREAGRKEASLTCKGIHLIYTDSLRFITRSGLNDIVDREYGITNGVRLPEIRLDQIEEIICSHPEVKDCQAWIERDCFLHIRLTQRTPAVRYENAAREGFYCERGGATFPVCAHYEVDVPVIRGDVERSDAWLREMEEFVSELKTLDADSVWVSKGDIFLRCSRGEETFIIGPPRGCGERIRKIDCYYDKIKHVKEYTTVNLKYGNQIICKNVI